MSNFMERWMGRKSSTPAQSAKDRLKFVLITDRTTISPEDLRNMQAEILDVIRKYCRIKEDDVDIKFEQRERESYLVADIPLSAGRTGEGGSIRLETTITTEEDEEDQPTIIIPKTNEADMPDEKTSTDVLKDIAKAPGAPSGVKADD